MDSVVVPDILVEVMLGRYAHEEQTYALKLCFFLNGSLLYLLRESLLLEPEVPSLQLFPRISTGLPRAAVRGSYHTCPAFTCFLSI